MHLTKLLACAGVALMISVSGAFAVEDSKNPNPNCSPGQKDCAANYPTSNLSKDNPTKAANNPNPNCSPGEKDCSANYPTSSTSKTNPTK